MKTNWLMILIIALNSQLYSQQGWQYQISNLYCNQYGAICPINKDTVFVIADNGKILKTFDGGTNWIEQNTGFSETFFDLSFSDSDTGYAVGQNGTIIKSINGGTNWTSLTSGTNKDLFSIFINTPDNIWVVGDSGMILNSNDNGNTWLINDSSTDRRLNSIRFQNTNTGFIAGNNGTLFRTLNCGIDWDTINIATTKDLYSITVTDNYAYLLAGWIDDYYYDGDELYKTSDNINWTSYFLYITIPGLSKLFFQNDSIGFYITSNMTTNGVEYLEIYKTTDYGNSWEISFNDVNTPSMVGISYSDIIFITDSIGYALSGDNILKTIDGGIFVSIKELKDNHYFNFYPNPSLSDKLNIEFSITNLNGLSVEIYDLSGKLILFENKLNNSSNIDISNIKEGVYFIKLLQGNNIIDTKKLIKLK